MKAWYVTIAMVVWLLVGVTTRFLRDLPGLAPMEQLATPARLRMLAWAAIWAGLMGYGRFTHPMPYRAARGILSFAVFLVPLAAMVAFPHWQRPFALAWMCAFVGWIVIEGAAAWRDWSSRGTIG